MEAIESLLRVLTVMLATGLGPGPMPVDPASELRMPILSESSAAADAGELTGVARWQQTDGGSIDPTTEEPLDNGAADAGDDGAEPLDAPTGGDTANDTEPLDNGTAATQPPSDLPRDNQPSATTAAPTTATSAPTTTTSKSVLPEDFGRGETVVLNPPAGETVTVPTDCKRVLEHGRAVIGLNCGSDDGPWWLSEVGTLAPAKGWPFDKGPSTVTAPAGSSQAVILNAGGSQRETVEGLLVNGRVTLRDQPARGPKEVRTRAAGDERHNGLAAARERVRRVVNNPTRRGDDTPRSSQRSSEQEARRFTQAESKRGKKQGNACQRLKQKATAGASKQDLSKLRHKCQQFRKAQAGDR